MQVDSGASVQVTILDDESDEATFAGDANGDGRVNYEDFLILLAGFGQKTDAGAAGGDFNEDGLVAFDDFLALAANFGRRIQEPLRAAATDSVFANA